MALPTRSTMATRTGRDGKRYPAAMPGGALPQADRAQVIELEHHLRCALGLSYTAIQAELAAEHGIRRSRGSIHHDVAAFTCEWCVDGLPEPGANVTEAASAAW